MGYVSHCPESPTFVLTRTPFTGNLADANEHIRASMCGCARIVRGRKNLRGHEETVRREHQKCGSTSDLLYPGNRIMRKNQPATEATTSKVIQFAVHAPNAQQVFLAGAFNEWNPDVSPMTRGDNGEWTAECELPPGRYEYKFVIDGEWRCKGDCEGDSGCTLCVPNDFGTMNRVCEVT